MQNCRSIDPAALQRLIGDFDDRAFLIPNRFQYKGRIFQMRPKGFQRFPDFKVIAHLDEGLFVIWIVVQHLRQKIVSYPRRRIVVQMILRTGNARQKAQAEKSRGR